jgi:hypothetical protein
MTPADLAGKSELMPVSYTGFGFMLLKRGVFEAISYPCFRPVRSKSANWLTLPRKMSAFACTPKNWATKSTLSRPSGTKKKSSYEKKIRFYYAVI